LLAYDRVLEKCLWGPGNSWKSPGTFCNQEIGNPGTIFSGNLHDIVKISREDCGVDVPEFEIMR